MNADDQRAYWLETAGLALASVLLFRIGLLGLVFLVPIQLAWIRRGETAGLISSGVAILGIAAIKGIDVLRLRSAAPGAEAAGLVFLDVVFVAGLLAGLFVMNSERVVIPIDGNTRRPPTVAERMIAATFVGAIVYGPTIALVATGGGAEWLLATQIELLRPLLESAGATTDEIRLLVDIIVAALLSGVLLGYFVMLVGNWWIGVQLAFRTSVRLPGGNPVMARHAEMSLTEFALPGYLVWALIAAWSGVLATVVLQAGWVAYLFWNAAFVTTALYAIQGIALVWYFLDRYKAQRSMRLLTAVALIVGLLIPGLQLAIMLGLPGLGVSEIWVDYHRLKGSEEAQ